MQRRKRYLYLNEDIPARTKRWRRKKSGEAGHSRVMVPLNLSDSTEADSCCEARHILSIPSDVNSCGSSDPTVKETADCVMARTQHGIYSASENDNIVQEEAVNDAFDAEEELSSDNAEVGSINEDASDDTDEERQEENVSIHSADNADYLGLRLSDTTDTTKGDALLMCLALGLRHALSWEAIVDVLRMINCLFGQDVIKSSKYFFQKYMDAGKSGNLVYHLYCSYCERYLGPRNSLSENFKCSCGQELEDIKTASSFFLSLDMGSQIKELLLDPLFVQSLRYRFNRVKENEEALEDIYDGEVYRELSAPGGVLSYWYNMSYVFNTDGFPVGGKSGKQSCWPIYFQINELPPKLRHKFMLLAGIFVGKKQPNMTIFMHPFVEEANTLSSKGLTWTFQNRSINSKVIPLFACVDSPARSKLLNTTQYSGKYGCSLCFQNPVETRVGRRYPLRDSSTVERTHISILKDAYQAHLNIHVIRNKRNRRVRGVKGPSPIHNLLYFDLVRGVRPDFMHSIILGNARYHMNIFYERAGHSYYIGSEVRMMAITKRLLSIRPPSSLFRTPREFASCGSWKATEWLSWILFYAIPCLKNIIPDEYVRHLSLLSTILHIVLGKSICRESLDTAHKLVVRYLFVYEHYFGVEAMVSNMHLLVHLKRSIECVGPAWNNMAFAFEGANKFLGEMRKGASSIAKEIAVKYITFKSLPILCEKYGSTKNSLEFCESLSGRPLLKNFHRIDNVMVVGNGKEVTLTPEERDCFSSIAFDSGTGNSLCHDRFIKGGVNYSHASYCRSTKTDDSYITLKDGTMCQIQKILSVAKAGSRFLVLLVREILTDIHPLLNEEYSKHSPLKGIVGTGRLFAIKPEDISGQCLAMHLENGNFICSIPFGCYGHS